MDQKHSVTFGDGTIYPYGDHTKRGFARGANTWDDWHLIPTSRPEIGPPEVYTSYVELPGVHGKLDLSEYLTGGPVYRNRTGSLDFIVANGYGFWAERFSQICNFLHGHHLYMVLWDEPEYFYSGRFTVQSYGSDGKTNWSSVSIGYELDPFKFLLPRSSLDQYWDRFLLDDIHPYEFMHKLNAGDSPTFTIKGYSNGFMLDGFIDDSTTSYPATASVTLNGQTITLTKSMAGAHTSKSGSLDPVCNTSNAVTVTGSSGVYVNLFCWGGCL